MNAPRRAAGAATDVLVIDDSPLAAAAMVNALRDVGIRARSIDSPIGATQAIVRSEAQLVIVDMNMPSLQGDRLVTLLRGVDRLREVKLVLASADEGDALPAAAREAGADGFYRKTSGPAVLVELARSLLGRRPESGVRPRRDTPESTA